MDINGDDGSLAARWLQDVMDDQCMTRVGRHDDGHTYEKGDKRSRIDHWLAGHNVADRTATSTE